MPLSLLSLRVGALLPVLLGITLTRFLAMGHYALQRKVYPGFKTLVFTELLGLGSLAVSILRVGLGDTAAIVFSMNFLLLAHAVLVYHGFGAYVRAPKLNAGTKRWLVLCFVVSLAQVCDAVFAPDMARRVAVFSVMMMILNLRVGAGLLWRARRPLPGLRLVCFSYFVTAGLGALRLLFALKGYELTYGQMLQADTLLAGFVLVRILQSVLELYAAFTMGELDKAEDYYKKAASSNGIHPDPYLGLATIAVQRGDLDGALDLYSKAHGIDATDKTFAGIGLIRMRAWNPSCPMTSRRVLMRGSSR